MSLRGGDLSGKFVSNSAPCFLEYIMYLLKSKFLTVPDILLLFLCYIGVRMCQGDIKFLSWHDLVLASHLFGT